MARSRECIAFGSVGGDAYGKVVIPRKIDCLAMETSAGKCISYVAWYATKKFRVLFVHLAKTAWLIRMYLTLVFGVVDAARAYATICRVPKE